MNSHAEARSSRMERLMSQFGMDGHPEDRFWARQSDLIGVGMLRFVGRSKAPDKQVSNLVVEIVSGGLLIYLSTSNPACWGDLWNLERVPVNSKVAFSGSVRSFDGRGVRMGRLEIQPCAEAPDRALFMPKVRYGGLIELGEGVTDDPAPHQATFQLLPTPGGVEIATVGVHA